MQKNIVDFAVAVSAVFYRAAICEWPSIICHIKAARYSLIPPKIYATTI